QADLCRPHSREAARHRDRSRCVVASDGACSGMSCAARPARRQPWQDHRDRRRPGDSVGPETPSEKDMNNEIATKEVHRGVGIHDCQPPERIEAAVKPAIDAVLAMTMAADLLAYCQDVRNPPESRLLAAAKLEALFELAASDRVARPVIDLEFVRAVVAG